MIPLRASSAVGDVLREFRTARSLSQEEVARRAGLSMTYISLVETGKRNPTISTVGRVLAALNVSWKIFGEAMDDHPSDSD